MINDEEKQKLIEQLKKTPVIQVACQQAGIGRASYYRWRKDDTDFADQADEAIKHGSDLLNDMAEWQLVSLIKDKNLGAITFWLKHRHPSYGNRLELTTKVKHEINELSDEQRAVVEEALKLAGFDPLS